MTERGVVVAVELAVQRVQVAVVQDGQRVDFNQRQVLFVEDAVQVDHDAGELAGLLGSQAHLEADVTAVVALHALDEVHIQGVDLVRGLGSNLLDLHAAFRGGDEADGTGATIDQHRQVQLLDDLTGGGHQHQVDRQLDAGGLVGGHLGAEHLGRSGLDVFDGLAELDAAGLAAAACVDLRLDHPGALAQRLGDCNGFIRGSRDLAGRNRDAVLGKQLF